MAEHHSIDDAAAQAFWALVCKAEPESCWLWQGRIGGGKWGRWYGGFSFKGTRHYAHRFSYMLHHGPIPAGLWVLHRCDTPMCVNPAHLFLGTNLDNIADRNAKGRQAKGERHRNHLYPERRPRGARHGQAKLDEAKVLLIRSRAAYGERAVVIAADFGVSRRTIRDIINRKLWTHI